MKTHCSKVSDWRRNVIKYLHLMSPNYQRPTFVALDNAVISHLHITTGKIYQSIVDQKINIYFTGGKKPRINTLWIEHWIKIISIGICPGLGGNGFIREYLCFLRYRFSWGEMWEIVRALSPIKTYIFRHQFSWHLLNIHKTANSSVTLVSLSSYPMRLELIVLYSKTS